MVAMFDICDRNKKRFCICFLDCIGVAQGCVALSAHILHYRPAYIDVRRAFDLFLGSRGVSSKTCLLLGWDEATATEFCGYFKKPS